MEYVVSIGEYKSKASGRWVPALMISGELDNVDACVILNRKPNGCRLKIAPHSDVADVRRYGGFNATSDGLGIFRTATIPPYRHKLGPVEEGGDRWTSLTRSGGGR